MARPKDLEIVAGDRDWGEVRVVEATKSSHDHSRTPTQHWSRVSRTAWSPKGRPRPADGSEVVAVIMDPTCTLLTIAMCAATAATQIDQGSSTRIAEAAEPAEPPASVAPAPSWRLQPGRALVRLEDLADHGSAVEIDPAGLSGGGWVTIKAVDTDREGLRDADWWRGRLGGGGDSRFASPILVDAAGGVRAATSQLVVGIDRSRPFEEEIERMALAGAGEVLATDLFGLDGVVLFETGLRDGASIWELARALAAWPRVRFAEPRCLLSATPLGGGGESLLGDCWGLENTGDDLAFCGETGGVVGIDLEASAAWTTTRGEPSILIAVLDTGIAFDHPDLATSAGPGFDATGADGGGWPVSPCDNHGTPVAGCIAANDDAHGVAGIAPETTVASARIAMASADCATWTADSTWIAAALAWATSIDARITNTSWRFAESLLVAEAYAQTASAGVLHIAAAGNAGADTVDFPASLSQVLAVGAVTRWGSVASFSNRGEALEFVAPGQIVLCPDRPGPSGYHPGDFVCLNGTSFASPFVAGIAALALSVDPALSRGQLVSILRNSTRDLGQVGWDPSHGWGLPQADLVVDAARHPGDLDRNGMVNATDLAMLLSRWGDVGPTGDLDGDGLVGASDLAILLADWTG